MIYINVNIHDIYEHKTSAFWPGWKSVILSLERIKEGLSLFTHVFAYCLNFLQQTCFYSVLASKTLKKIHICSFVLYYVYYSTMIYYGEGNGTPLHYSCLENPMDGEAW